MRGVDGQIELRFDIVVSLGLQRGERHAQQADRLRKGISACSRAIAKLSKSSRLDKTAGTDRFRVMISKSKNLTLSVTVRPRLPVLSQWRQTLSISGRSSAAMASNVVRSAANVFSAPIDLWMRFARTGPAQSIDRHSGLLTHLVCQFYD
ncbi:hypothetical protein AC630_19540 [Bradyrhizobium sp. AS23.2]|nr:hypothetical protein AC630_19540 [Bradyrhizobium sp. AS23.2]